MTQTTVKSLPILITFLLSYCIASAFFNVYDMCLRTILLMYCKATEMNARATDVPERFQKFMENSFNTLKRYHYVPDYVEGDPEMEEIRLQ